MSIGGGQFQNLYMAVLAGYTTYIILKRCTVPKLGALHAQPQPAGLTCIDLAGFSSRTDRWESNTALASAHKVNVVCLRGLLLQPPPASISICPIHSQVRVDTSNTPNVHLLQPVRQRTLLQQLSTKGNLFG